MKEITFPDGTIVRGSALKERVVDDPWRDHGLYLDPAWDPTWPADLIEWPDFGVPTDSEQAAQTIVKVFALAQAGKQVEVGCLGGRGRTGTVLACMAIMAGVPPERAVRYVRRHYRVLAVETRGQHRWIRWFATWWNEQQSPTSRV